AIDLQIKSCCPRGLEPVPGTWWDNARRTGFEFDIDIKVGSAITQLPAGHDDIDPQIIVTGRLRLPHGSSQVLLGKAGHGLLMNDTVRQLESITAYAIELATDTAESTGSSRNPGSADERRPMTYVLSMAAAKEGEPVALRIYSETGHRSFHITSV